MHEYLKEACSFIVVPVILSQSGVKGADELVVSLFHCLISSVRPEHSDESKSPFLCLLAVLMSYTYTEPYSCCCSHQLLLLNLDLLCRRVRRLQRLPRSVGEPAPAAIAAMQGRQRGCISTLRYTYRAFHSQYVPMYVCMYVCIGTVLRKVSAIIQIPLSTFINKILLESGGGDEEGNVALTELEEHVYVVIFELHKISSTLLSRIIPTICQQMVEHRYKQ